MCESRRYIRKSLHFLLHFAMNLKIKSFSFFLKKEVYLTLDTKHILIIGNKILCTLSESLIQ